MPQRAIPPLSLATIDSILASQNRDGFCARLVPGRPATETAEILASIVATNARAGHDAKKTHMVVEARREDYAGTRHLVNGDRVISIDRVFFRNAPIGAVRFIAAHENAHPLTDWKPAQFLASKGAPLFFLVFGRALAPSPAQLRQLRRIGYLGAQRQNELATDFRAIGLFPSVQEGISCMREAIDYTARHDMVQGVAPILRTHPQPRARLRIAERNLRKAGLM